MICFPQSQYNICYYDRFPAVGMIYYVKRTLHNMFTDGDGRRVYRVRPAVAQVLVGKRSARHLPIETSVSYLRGGRIARDSIQDVCYGFGECPLVLRSKKQKTNYPLDFHKNNHKIFSVIIFITYQHETT